MLKVISSENCTFQSYQNKKSIVHKNKITNRNANVAAVIRHTRAKTKAQRKRLSTSKVFISDYVIVNRVFTEISCII